MSETKEGVWWLRTKLEDICTIWNVGILVCELVLGYHRGACAAGPERLGRE